LISLLQERIAENIMVPNDIEKTGLFLASALEEVSEAIIIEDAAGRIVYVNRSFEKITAGSRDVLVGQQLEVLRRMQCGAAFYRSFRRSHPNQKRWFGRIVSATQNGDPYQADASISPVNDSAGRRTHSILVARNITNERRLESQLIQAQKMEAIGTLAGGIAHDFNNILSAIIGYVELAQLQIPPENPVNQLLF